MGGKETSLFWPQPKSESVRVVRGMVNAHGEQMLVVRTFNDPQQADGLVSMLASIRKGINGSSVICDAMRLWQTRVQTFASGLAKADSGSHGVVLTVELQAL